MACHPDLQVSAWLQRVRPEQHRYQRKRVGVAFLTHTRVTVAMERSTRDRSVAPKLGLRGLVAHITFSEALVDVLAGHQRGDGH
jgi:hypothetical protein